MQDKADGKTKVKPYPINAKLTFGTEVISAQILKLVPSGFLADTAKTDFKTGERFQVSFEIPVFHKEINETCVIVKLYTSADSHVIEGHFQSPSHETENVIMKFNAATTKAHP